MFYLIYNTLLAALYFPYVLLARLIPRLGAFRQSRVDGQRRLSSFLEQHGPDHIIWLHAASVGELDQARALAREIRTRHAGARIIASVFSLSVKKTELPEFDLIFFLPLDFSRNWEGMLADFRPIFFATMTWDVWPNLLRALSRRGVPVYLCSAALAGDSPRLRGWRLNSLRPVYANFSGIGAVDEDNRERFLRLLPAPERVRVTGDSRFDTILHKIAGESLDADTAATLKRLKGDSKLWIHASTYAADDDELFAGLAELLGEFPDWRVFIFPHHVDEERLRAVETRASDASLSIGRYSLLARAKDRANSDSGDGPRLVLVDAMGILALAYRYGDFCYVGGGFHHRIHNTAEPAALGLPTLTGPRIDTSPIALELEKAGVLKRLNAGDAITRQARAWMKNAAERETAGRRARQLVQERAGGSRAFYDTFLSDLF